MVKFKLTSRYGCVAVSIVHPADEQPQPDFRLSDPRNVAEELRAVKTISRVVVVYDNLKPMLTSLAQEMTSITDLSHEARRFRVVLEGFNRNVELLFGNGKISPHVNAVAVAEAFSNWKSAFEASRELAAVNRTDFVFCAAGLMLKELFTSRPLADLGKVMPEDIPAAAADWPEGYAYVNFCASMAEAVLSGMGEKRTLKQDIIQNPAFWQSFRENVADNVSTAPGFLDLLFGNEPNWNGPDVPSFRPGMRAALGLLGR